MSKKSVEELRLNLERAKTDEEEAWQKAERIEDEVTLLSRKENVSFRESKRWDNPENASKLKTFKEFRYKALAFRKRAAKIEKKLQERQTS